MASVKYHNVVCTKHRPLRSADVDSWLLTDVIAAECVQHTHMMTTHKEDADNAAQAEGSQLA